MSEHREQGLTFDAIAKWLTKEGYLTVRGKRFRGTHVHSILKKRLAKEELLNREYPKVWSDFSMEVVDKTILMSDFGFHSEKKVTLRTASRGHAHLTQNFSMFLQKQSRNSQTFKIIAQYALHTLNE